MDKFCKLSYIRKHTNPHCIMTLCNIPWNSHSFPSARLLFSLAANTIKPLLDIAKSEGVSSGDLISLSHLQSNADHLKPSLFLAIFFHPFLNTVFISFSLPVLFSPTSLSLLNKEETGMLWQRCSNVGSMTRGKLGQARGS